MMSSRGARMAVAVTAATFALFAWGAFSHMVMIRGVGYAAIPTSAASSTPPCRARSHRAFTHSRRRPTGGAKSQPPSA
jgi:hypothetical protein